MIPKASLTALLRSLTNKYKEVKNLSHPICTFLAEAEKGKALFSRLGFHTFFHTLSGKISPFCSLISGLIFAFLCFLFSTPPQPVQSPPAELKYCLASLSTRRPCALQRNMGARSLVQVQVLLAMSSILKNQHPKQEEKMC